MTPNFRIIRNLRFILLLSIFTTYMRTENLLFAATLDLWRMLSRKKGDSGKPRQIRQLECIGQYTTVIWYIKCEFNFVADVLSRIEGNELIDYCQKYISVKCQESI
jgi:hypothetical protein